MRYERTHRGSIIAPRTFAGPNGELGDGHEELEPGGKGYDDWDQWLHTQGLGEDEVFRYGVTDTTVDLPLNPTARHDSEVYPGGIVTYDRRISPVNAKQMGLTPIYPDHHQSSVISEMVEHWGGAPAFFAEWDTMPAMEQNQTLRLIADQTGESIWTLRHELEGLRNG